jgi:hypothetical protein
MGTRKRRVGSTQSKFGFANVDCACVDPALPRQPARVESIARDNYGGAMQVLATYRFSVDEYHRLGEARILGEDDRVELLNGDLIT